MIRRRRLSTLSNEIISEATGPIWSKFNLLHLWAGGLKVCVFLWLLSLVAIATKSFHRLIIGKIEKLHLLPSHCRYVDKTLVEMILE